MSVVQFFNGDFGASLFPLKTNQVLMQTASAELAAYVDKVLSEAPENIAYSFLPQQRAYAAKPKGHLRRTLVLDPVATYFLYDLIYRNRSAFPKPSSSTRSSYGYYFDGESPEPVRRAYNAFKSDVSLNSIFQEHCLSFDIASYFNSVYHHDATNWFATLPGVTGPDASAFGRFFREINAGRSVDFLPHGIYPAKVIGSAFLKYIDDSQELQSAVLLRFMDDFYLFDDKVDVLYQDFSRVQQLLGIKALNVNPTKTLLDASATEVHVEASSLKSELAALAQKKSGHIYRGSGVEYDEDEEDDEDAEYDEYSDSEDDEGVDDDLGEGRSVAVENAKIERLKELLVDPRADENDVEIILGVLNDHQVELSTYIVGLLTRFPSIAKQLHALCGEVADIDTLSADFVAMLDSTESLSEYQLFWIGAIAEDYLSGAAEYGAVLLKTYNRASGMKLAQAKILEIPEQGFGLKAIRDEILKSGASDWISWAAAVGTRTLNKAERNYALKYFSKGSLINHLIASCVEKLP